MLLNVVAASYATWRLHAGRAIDWNAVGRLATASLPAALVGGLIVLDARIYMILTGLVLILAGGLMVTRRKADTVGNRPMQSTPILMIGAGAGLLSGLTGVGGGVWRGDLRVRLALVGAVIGTAIGLRWMSQAATRCVLASVPIFAGLRMLL